MKLKEKIKQKKSLIFALLLVIVTVIGTASVNMKADELSSTSEKKVITSFGSTQTILNDVEHRTLEELLDQFPKEMNIKLSDETEEVIDCKWECSYDYDNTDFPIYSFKLVLPDGYVASDKLKEVDIPYVHAVMKESEMRPYGANARAARAANTISGNCYVVNTAIVYGGVSTFNVTMPDGKVYQGYCQNPGFPTPIDGTYSFTGTLTSNGTYQIAVNSSYITSDMSMIHPGEAGHMLSDPPWRTQMVGFSGYTTSGFLKVKKTSANPEITNGSSCYSFEGAEFAVYSDRACTAKVGTLRTNASGISNTIELNSGTYYVKETVAPKGYALEREPKSVTISSGDTATVTFADKPQNDPVTVVLGKIDADTTADMPQGSASLGNAEYTFRFYEGLSDTDPAESGKVPLRTWVIKTNDNGRAYLSDRYKVSGDDFWYMSSGLVTLPLGTLTIQETKAPEGYLINNEVYVRQITPEGDSEVVLTYNEPIAPERIIRGGVQVQKWDKELDKSEALGGKDHGNNTTGTSLEGIEFSIINKSENAVLLNDILFEPDEVVMTIKTHWNKELKAYTAETEADALPYGKYEMKETATNDSYLLTDSDPKPFEITEDGKIVTVDTEGKDLVFKDQVVRGDVKFTKIANTTSKRMSVPFLLTNLTTGEKHVVVTDKNGEFSSSSDWNKHSTDTNANDALLDKETIKAADLKPKAGVWFSLGEDGSHAKVKNSLGALPYGDYEIEELTCETNNGYGMQKFAFSIYRDNTVVDLATITNDSEPEIRTTATDGRDGDKLMSTSQNEVIVDKVEYIYLRPGEEYEVRGKVYEKVTGDDGTVVEKPLLDKNGNEITATKLFTPKSEFGYVELEFTFDAALMEGKTAVVFEELYKDGKVVVVHSDINDKDQTVEFKEPEIRTTATDMEDGDHKIYGKENVTIVDSVEYKNLNPGTEYVLTGTLMEKIVDDETGEIEGTPLLDNEGNPIKVTKSFIPDKESGKELINFTFDASLMAGKTVVVFEELYREDKIIAVHTDIKDKGQTVEIITNTKLEISKNDFVTGEPVEGATLQIIDKEGNVVAEWVTGSEPYYVEGISPGDYILRETIVPDGYVRSEEVEFTLNDDGEIQKVEMLDDYTKVEISKKDFTDGAEIEGATLQILDKHGNVKEEWITDGEPHYIEKLPTGEYILKEISAPKGYAKAEQIPFVVAETGNIQKVEMLDKRVEGYIVVEKVSSVLRTPIQGVEFTLTDEDGKVIGVYKTDSNGFLKTDVVQIGKYENGVYKGSVPYYIQETKCPEEYVLDSTKYKVVMEYLNDETPLVYQKLTVPNVKKTGEDIPTKSVAKTKQTGDTSPIKIFMFIAFAGIAGFCITMLYRRKTNIKNKSNK